MFPAPTPSYSSSGFIGEIIYVPKYARDPQTGEVVQFVDPDSEKRSQSQQPVVINNPDSPSARKSSSLRKSVLGDAGFSKEELALKNIREDANLNVVKQPSENEGSEKLGSNHLNAYQRHVAKVDAERKK